MAPAASRLVPPLRVVELGEGKKEADLAVAVAFSRKTRVFPEIS